MSELPPSIDPNDDPNLDPSAHSSNLDPSDPGNADPNADPSSVEQESLPDLEQLPLLKGPYEARTQAPPTPEELSEFSGLLATISRTADQRHNIKNNLVASPNQAAADEAANKFWTAPRGKDGKYPSRRDELVAEMKKYLERHPAFRSLAHKSLEGEASELETDKGRHIVAMSVANIGMQRLADATEKVPNYKTSKELKDTEEPDPSDYRFLGVGPKFKNVRRLPKFTHGVLQVETATNKKGEEEPVRPYRTPYRHREDTREFYGNTPQPYNYTFIGGVKEQTEAWVKAREEYLKHKNKPNSNDYPDPGPLQIQAPERTRPAGFSRESAANSLADDRILQGHLRAEAAWTESNVSKAQYRVSSLSVVISLAEKEIRETSFKPVRDLEEKWQTTTEEQAEKLYDAGHESFGTYRQQGELTTEYEKKHIDSLNEAVTQLRDIDTLLQSDTLKVPVYNELIRKRAELANALVQSRYRYHLTTLASGSESKAAYTNAKGIDLNDDSKLTIFEDGSYAYVGETAIVLDRRKADGTPHDGIYEPDIAEIPIEENLPIDELYNRQYVAFTAWFDDQSNFNLRDEALAYTDELAVAYEQQAETSGNPEDIRTANIMRYWSEFIAKRHDNTDEDELQLWPGGGLVKYDNYHSIDGWWQAFPDGTTLLVNKNQDGTWSPLRHFDAYGNEIHYQ